MATIEKVAIYDPRLVQTPPVYGVQKGALSVSTAKFAALAANTSQHTYQILVPSLNVFVDRKIVWDAGVYVTAAVWPALACDPFDQLYTSASPTPAAITSNPAVGFGGSANPFVCAQADARSELYRRTLTPGCLGVSSDGTTPYPFAGKDASNINLSGGGDYYEFVQPGSNFSLCPFPLQSLCTNMTASVNDCSVTTNGDTLQEQIFLTDTRMTNRIRTTPAKFDRYAWTTDDVQTTNGNLSTFDTAEPGVGEIPNGAWPITFYDPSGSGAVLGATSAAGAYIDPQYSQPVYYINGRPVLIPGGVPQGTSFSVVANGGVTAAISGSNLLVSVTVPTNTVVPELFVGGNVFLQGFGSGAGTGDLSLNGYYIIAQISYPSTSIALLTLPIGAVAQRSGSTTQLKTRVSGGVAITATSMTVTSGYKSTACITPLSKLLGQILPDGTQVQPSAMNLPATVCFKYNVQEPVIMSPFIYQDALEFNSVGLYGCTNIQFTMNLQTPANNCQAITQTQWPASASANFAPAPFSQPKLSCDYPSGAGLIRSTGVTGVWSSVVLLPPAGQQSSGYGPFETPQMVVQFLTPGPDVSLPLISNVPYMELPRYIKQDELADATAKSFQITTQTITLSSIPDTLMVFVKPRKRSQCQNETYIPIQKVQVTFDNFSNLCANMTQQELYQSSVAAGLDMDYQTWRGWTAGGAGIQNNGGIVLNNNIRLSSSSGIAGFPCGTVVSNANGWNLGGSQAPAVLSATTNDLYTPGFSLGLSGQNKYTQTRATQLVGGPLMLRMGQDVSLSPGLAPGTLGNYSLQLTLTLDNSYGFFNAYKSVQTTIIAINSGYFETVRGQSAVRKTILNMADVEAAHADSGITTTALRRLVGGHHTTNAGLGGYGMGGSKAAYGGSHKRGRGSGL